MIMQALGSLAAQGKHGAAGHEIQTEINRVWGFVDSNQVRPALWRMVQRGTVRKDRNGLHSLPK